MQRAVQTLGIPKARTALEEQTSYTGIVCRQELQRRVFSMHYFQKMSHDIEAWHDASDAPRDTGGMLASRVLRKIGGLSDPFRWEKLERGPLLRVEASQRALKDCSQLQPVKAEKRKQCFATCATPHPLPRIYLYKESVLNCAAQQHSFTHSLPAAFECHSLSGPCRGIFTRQGSKLHHRGLM